MFQYEKKETETEKKELLVRIEEIETSKKMLTEVKKEISRLNTKIRKIEEFKAFLLGGKDLEIEKKELLARIKERKSKVI